MRWFLNKRGKTQFSRFSGLDAKLNIVPWYNAWKTSIKRAGSKTGSGGKQFSRVVVEFAYHNAFAAGCLVLQKLSRIPGVFVVAQYVIEPLASNFTARYISPGENSRQLYIAKSARDLPQAWKYNPGYSAGRTFRAPWCSHFSSSRIGFRPASHARPNRRAKIKSSLSRI